MQLFEDRTILKPTIASDWTRIVNYPDNHLNDFAIFQAQDGTWHAFGIMGEGSFDTEVSLFHCSSPDLFGTFEHHEPILKETPDPYEWSEPKTVHLDTGDEEESPVDADAGAVANADTGAAENADA